MHTAIIRGRDLEGTAGTGPSKALGGGDGAAYILPKISEIFNEI